MPNIKYSMSNTIYSVDLLGLLDDEYTTLQAREQILTNSKII